MTMTQDTQTGSPMGDGGQNQTIENVKSKLGELAEPVKEKAVEVAQEQKNAGADQMRSFANAVHGAARELESEMPQIANMIHDTGEKIQRVASDIRERDLNELIDRFSGYARQQPALVFGGAVLAGFVLSRFLKSSSTPQMPRTQTSPSQNRNLGTQNETGVNQSDYYG